MNGKLHASFTLSFCYCCFIPAIGSVRSIEVQRPCPAPLTFWLTSSCHSGISCSLGSFFSAPEWSMPLESDNQPSLPRCVIHSWDETHLLAFTAARRKESALSLPSKNVTPCLREGVLQLHNPLRHLRARTWTWTLPEKRSRSRFSIRSLSWESKLSENLAFLALMEEKTENMLYMKWKINPLPELISCYTRSKTNETNFLTCVGFSAV